MVAHTYTQSGTFKPVIQTVKKEEAPKADAATVTAAEAKKVLITTDPINSQSYISPLKFIVRNW